MLLFQLSFTVKSSHQYQQRHLYQHHRCYHNNHHHHHHEQLSNSYRHCGKVSQNKLHLTSKTSFVYILAKYFTKSNFSKEAAAAVDDGDVKDDNASLASNICKVVNPYLTHITQWSVETLLWDFQPTFLLPILSYYPYSDPKGVIAPYELAFYFVDFLAIHRM